MASRLPLPIEETLILVSGLQDSDLKSVCAGIGYIFLPKSKHRRFVKLTMANLELGGIVAVQEKSIQQYGVRDLRLSRETFVALSREISRLGKT